MPAKRFAFALMIPALCLALGGCTSTGSLPLAEDTPSVTLPPAEVSYVAPIGDAALEYEAPATLYLPSRDGISLTTVETDVTYSPVRPHADSLVRTLLGHSGTKEAKPLGGGVKLSLYGISPVEVSRNVATVNLGASALQLDRESLYLTCQAIANTLCGLAEIDYVNVLVVDKPVGADIANTLPLGAFQQSSVKDQGAVYKQLLSRRVGSDERAESKPFSANVTLYFPLSGADGMVSEARTLSFENQVFADMVTAILRELGAGPRDRSIASSPLPLLSDLLVSTPSVRVSEEAGGSIIALDFAHNLVDMLEAYGVTHQQSIASLCYTLSTFFPNVSGVTVSINGTPLAFPEIDGEAVTGDSGTHLRHSFAAMLYDYSTLYFVDGENGSLSASVRPLPYYQCSNPRTLLNELSRGPQPYDSQPQLLPVIHSGTLNDTDMLGFALEGSTLLVNFAPSFAKIGKELDGGQERALAYALVNTLCMEPQFKSVCFFQSGSQFEGFTGEIYWQGLFYPLPL